VGQQLTWRLAPVRARPHRRPGLSATSPMSRAPEEAGAFPITSSTASTSHPASLGPSAPGASQGDARRNLRSLRPATCGTPDGE
jgi:hypothetical protein